MFEGLISSSSGTTRGSHPVYSFAGFRLNPDGSLYRGETLIHLAPIELTSLRLLLARAGQIVTAAELQEAIWGNTHVTPVSLAKCMSSLRARLEPEKCIETVYKRGYRLTGSVRAVHCETSALPARLAIVPFSCEFGVPPHFGPGVAEEIIARLSNDRGHSVSVIARDSVFSLAHRGMTALEIGSALEADLALTGTIRALPARFRLRAEMIRVSDGVQIWVEDALLDSSNIATVEAGFASQLAFRLSQPKEPVGWKAKLMQPQSAARVYENISTFAVHIPERAAGMRAQTSEAYDLFRRGHHEWQSLQRNQMQDGLEHLQRATELDPTLIAAKIDLARLCVTQTYLGTMASPVAADMIRRTAESIPDILGQAPEILLPVGWAYYNVDHNLAAALWAFSNTRHLPHNNWNTRDRVMLALSRHRFDEAAAINDQALVDDPYSPWLHARRAWVCHMAGQATQSVEYARQALSLYPDHDGIGIYASMILAFNGHAALSLKVAEDFANRQGHSDLSDDLYAYALACAGRHAEAHALLEKLQWMSRERFVGRCFCPAIHVALGEYDAAIGALRAAAGLRCSWFLQLLADPRMEPLHSHPEFQELKNIQRRMEAGLAVAPDEESPAVPAI